MFCALVVIKNMATSMAFCVLFFFLVSMPMNSMHLPCNKLLQGFCLRRSQGGNIDRCIKIIFLDRGTTAILQGYNPHLCFAALLRYL